MKSENIFPRSALKRPIKNSHPGTLQTAQHPDLGFSAATLVIETRAPWTRGQREHQAAQRALVTPESKRAGRPSKAMGVTPRGPEAARGFPQAKSETT